MTTQSHTDLEKWVFVKNQYLNLSSNFVIPYRKPRGREPATPFLTRKKQEVNFVDWMYYIFMPVKLVVAVCIEMCSIL